MSAGTGTSKVRIYAHPGRQASAQHPNTFGAAPTNKLEIVTAAAHKWGVPVSILWGVYGLETGFGTNLNVSSAGALGHFQFLPSTWAIYGKGHSPYNLSAAADAAAHYLHDLHNQFGSWDSALRHYSGGGYGYQQVAAKGHNLTLQATGPLVLNAPSIIPGVGDAVGKDLGGINAVVNPSGDGKPTLQLGDILGKFISKEVWVTLGKMVLGAVLLLMALHLAARNMGAYGAVQRSAGKAVKLSRIVR